MNVYDSARMADVLAPLGYRLVDGPDQADLILLNTCHIREKASEKVFSELGRLKPLTEAPGPSGGRVMLGVAGCVAQAEGAAILERSPFVDIVLGPQTIHRLPELIARAERAADQAEGRRHLGLLDTEFPVEPKFDHLPAGTGDSPISAFLAVQEGCDKFCSFCVVPYTRGAEYSRPAAAVLAEAAGLVGRGAREITLLGQNVNAYHGEGPEGADWDLARLIRALAEIPGLLRLRYTTSHPRDLDDSLIGAHRDVPQLMPFLHLPVQSGSDRVLAAMNRQHDVAAYRRLIERLRAARPDIALSTDIIVGYPGETDRDARDTLALIGDIGFAQAFSFKYSPRPGTPAALAADQVPEAVKEARLAEVQALLRDQQTAFNRSTVGRTLPVLFEKPGRHAGQLVGRTPYLQAVHATAAPGWLGRVADVTIQGVGSNSLAGCLSTIRTPEEGDSMMHRSLHALDHASSRSSVGEGPRG